MTSRTIYNIFFIIGSVFCSMPVLAQTKTVVRATIDRSGILIGEPIQLRLEADIPESQPIRFFQLDSLPHFEFLAKEKIDTTNTSYGTVLTQMIRMTSFDSGHWVIPPLVLQEGIATDSLPVDVGYFPSDPGQPYHDIRDVIGVGPEKKKKDPWWWYAIAGAILLALVLLWVFRKKKKPAPPVIMPRIDPYKEALDSLEKLKKEKPDPKQYYSRLTDIFRKYIFDRKGIHSLQQTTDDLVVQLRELAMPKEQFDRLSKVLRLSDFVKFAKYEPAITDEAESVEVIRQSIDQIERMP